MDESEKEIWKPTHVFSEAYEVSNYGNVRSVDRYKMHNTSKTGQVFIEGQMLKQGLNHKGYSMVWLSYNSKKKSIAVHRLVAIAFVPNPNGLPQVNHIDGNKQNNHISNLEWCDNSQNQLHAYKLGLNYHRETAGRRKIPVKQFDKDTHELLNEYESIADAARNSGLSPTGIRKAIYKETWKQGVVGGFYWEFADKEQERKVMLNEQF